MSNQATLVDESINLVEACRLATHRNIGLSATVIREIALRHCPAKAPTLDIYRVAANGEAIEKVASSMGLNLQMLKERYHAFISKYTTFYAFGTRPYISTGDDPMLGTPSFDTDHYSISHLSNEQRAELCQLVPPDALNYRKYEMTRLLYVEGLQLKQVAEIFDRSSTHIRQSTDRYLRTALRWVHAIMIDRAACDHHTPDDDTKVRERFHEVEREYLSCCLKTILRSRYTEIALQS